MAELGHTPRKPSGWSSLPPERLGPRAREAFLSLTCGRGVPRPRSADWLPPGSQRGRDARSPPASSAALRRAGGPGGDEGTARPGQRRGGAQWGGVPAGAPGTRRGARGDGDAPGETAPLAGLRQGDLSRPRRGLG